MTDKEIIQALRCCAKGLGHDDACDNWDVPQKLITHWMPLPDAPEVE